MEPKSFLQNLKSETKEGGLFLKSFEIYLKSPVKNINCHIWQPVQSEKKNSYRTLKNLVKKNSLSSIQYSKTTPIYYDKEISNLILNKLESIMNFIYDQKIINQLIKIKVNFKKQLY